ncbi:hypothetical protein [Salinisphaera sp. Q1T1-3]|uniref:hypothetical protein n=1 Tax=Salinisphaera sp. Q1T1-3 TaxID=2321229 RepID=UPI001F158A03|nr:hypothetical protein [Salinisphaera sp. Q1T1-3]
MLGRCLDIVRIGSAAIAIGAAQTITGPAAKTTPPNRRFVNIPTGAHVLGRRIGLRISIAAPVDRCAE